ncbi:hypothetical protein WA158_002732 [Blastocystis sp. Blastoise]
MSSQEKQGEVVPQETPIESKYNVLKGSKHSRLPRSGLNAKGYKTMKSVPPRFDQQLMETRLEEKCKSIERTMEENKIKIILVEANPSIPPIKQSSKPFKELISDALQQYQSVNSK